ncbi:MAG: hypothetical protein ABI658_27395 [Acidimicrobiales bacterium]
MRGYRALGLAAFAFAVASACTAAPTQPDAANTTPPAIVTASTTTPPLPATTPPTTTAPPVPTLRDSLVLANAGIDAAPESIRGLFGVETCGLVGRVQTPWTDTTYRRERRCFLDAFLTGRYVALVWIGGTIEGDPIVRVYFVLSDGSIGQLTDTTKDNFGEKTWYVSICRRATTSIGSPAGLDASFFAVDGCEQASSIPAQEAPRALPTFFSKRDELPLCGYILSPLDSVPGAVDCFRAALAAGTPAELVVTAARSDSGRVVHWFRVLRQGSFEVLTNTQSRTSSATTSAWVKQSCTRLAMPSDNAPPLTITTECQVVQTA